MQGCSTLSQWEAPAPALLWLDPRLCRDTEPLPVLPLCDPFVLKDVPVTLLARTRRTEGNLDLQTPSAWVLRAPHRSPHS